MSLSGNQPAQSTKLSNISVSPIRPVPALEKKPKEEKAPAETPAQAEAEPAPAKPAQATEAKGLSKWQGIALDTFLVAMVVGVLGGGGYYIKSQWDQYRVPTIMELTHAQCLELCAQREELQDAANHADEQLRMRRKLAHLEAQLSQFSAQNAQLNAAIADQQNRVLALQHEIRQADKEARTVAKGLLPGLAVGDVTTTRGKTYHNAIISRLQGKRIALRTPDGAASFPTSELVKENLPDIVLYAFGALELVDMSDFTANGAAPTGPTPKSPKLQTNRIRRSASKPDYEESAGGPIVDTEANKTSTNVGEDLPSVPRAPMDDVWTAPEGELPL